MIADRVTHSEEMGLTRLEFGEIVPGAFTPVLAKHSKSFSLIDCISVGVDRMQRNFEPMRKQVEAWHLVAVRALHRPDQHRYYAAGLRSRSGFLVHRSRHF